MKTIIINQLKKYPISIAALFVVCLFNTSCEDVIDVELDPAEQQLVVDAWLDNLSQNQVIRLSLSQAYFDNSVTPGVTDATVQLLKDDGTRYIFMHTTNGSYVWAPSAPGETLGEAGDEFTLSIQRGSETYESESRFNPVPPVDSITWEFRDDEIGGPDGLYAQFFSRDIVGLGNAYWIKTFKNDAFLNKPQEINIAFDAGFDPGAQVDGIIFITPIREAINRVPDDEGDDDADVAPWANNDKVRVEIHSLNQEAFSFMDLARDQMTNGDNGIFALPLANTTGNVTETTSGKKALGMFNMAMVSSLEETIVE